MSETVKTGQDHRKRRIVFFSAILGVMLLLLYGGGVVALPLSVFNAYKDKDCSSVLVRNDIYTSMYPAFLKDETLVDTVMECAVYLLADRDDHNQNWSASYNAYQVYVGKYPNGIYAGEAKIRSASVLFNLAQDQLAKEKYAEAITSLDLILAQYPDMAVSGDAQKIYTSLYMQRGTSLRTAGDFAGAEAAFKDFETWLQKTQQTGQVALVRKELAQTYLTWGLFLQSQKKFDDASTKLSLATLTSPDLQPDMASLYSQWGDFLVEQKDFSGAIGYYETAASLSKDQNTAKDAVANGYIQWANIIRSKDDFVGALILLEFAQDNASTDTTKELVKNTKSETYVAFSQSSSEQARQAIKDGVRILCEHHVKPRLPIFGLDAENVRVGLYGLGDVQLPENMTATAPASLHYVACVDEDSRIVGSLKVPLSQTMFGGPPGVVQVTYNNFQNIWNVVLREVDTGGEVATTTIKGEKPPALNFYTLVDLKTFSYFGSEPNIAELVQWVEMAVK